MTTPFPAGAPSAPCLREKRPPILRLDSLWSRMMWEQYGCLLAEQGGADQSTGDLLADWCVQRMLVHCKNRQIRLWSRELSLLVPH